MWPAKRSAFSEITFSGLVLSGLSQEKIAGLTKSE